MKNMPHLPEIYISINPLAKPIRVNHTRRLKRLVRRVAHQCKVNNLDKGQTGAAVFATIEHYNRKVSVLADGDVLGRNFHIHEIVPAFTERMKTCSKVLKKRNPLPDRVSDNKTWSDDDTKQLEYDMLKAASNND